MLRAGVDHEAGASRVHCGSSLITSARRWLNRVCKTSAVIGAPFVASLLPCVTTAGEAATVLLPIGTTNTPMLSNGTLCPPGSEKSE
eukprot:4311778-Pleurochrysis_carterae.AAC.2